MALASVAFDLRQQLVFGTAANLPVAVLVSHVGAFEGLLIAFALICHSFPPIGMTNFSWMGRRPGNDASEAVVRSRLSGLSSRTCGADLGLTSPCGAAPRVVGFKFLAAVRSTET